MQDETQNLGYEAPEERNNAPDPGMAANLDDWEGVGRDSSNEGPTAAPTDQGGSVFDLAASVGAEEVSFDPNGVAEEISATADIWQDTSKGLVEDVGAAFEDVGEAIGGVFDDIMSSPFSPTELDQEVDPASVDYSDPALFNTGEAGPWGTQPSATAEAEEEEPTFNPLFTTPWEDLGVPSPETVEQEEDVFTPWEDVGTQPPGTAEAEEDILNAPWEDPEALFSEMSEKKEEEEDEDIFTALLQSSGTGEQEEDIFAPPVEDDSTTPDPSIFPTGWDDVPDIPPEGQEDNPNAVYEEMPMPFDVSLDPNDMAEEIAEEISATADIWQDTAEGLVEDVGAAFEDVGEASQDLFDDTF